MARSFDPRQPYQTRRGEKAVILTNRFRNEIFPKQTMVVMLLMDNGYHEIAHYSTDGRYRPDGEMSDWDLVNVRKSRYAK